MGLLTFGCGGEPSEPSATDSVRLQPQQTVETREAIQPAPPSSEAQSNKEVVLALVLAAAQKQVSQVAMLELHKYRADGQWAYVTAIPQGEKNGRIDYTKTSFAADYADGFFDNWLCALAQKEAGGWRLVAFEFGATDAPFVDWPEKFGVSAQLILE